MRVASIAKEFQSQKRAHCMTGRDHLGARESCFLHQLIEGDLSQIRQEEKKTPEPSPEPAGREVELSHIGNGREFRPGARRSFIVFSPGQPCESLLFQNQGDGGGAQLVAGIFQRSADIVDGKVLLSQSNDLFTDFVHLG